MGTQLKKNVAVFALFIDRVGTAKDQRINSADCIHIFAGIRQRLKNITHGVQAGTLFIVALNDGPRCCHSVRVEEHGFFCLGVVIPFVERGHIDRRKFPALERMNLTLFEASSLFLATDGEPELDQVDSAAGQKALEFRALAHEFQIQTIGAETHDTLDAGPVVPRTVEQYDFTGGGQVFYVTLEVPFTERTLRRFFQSNDACSAGIEMLHEATDGAALSGCVAAFEQNNDFLSSLLDPVLKFQKLGIKTDYRNFITASYATIHYLKKNYDDKLIYVMGTKSLIRELKKSGIRVTTDCEDPEIACVLVAYDNELTYEKLTDTCKILSTRDVGYVATNPDLVCPIEFGFVPDCGAMCQMIEHAVKKKPYFIGKPEPGMVDMSVAQNHFTKYETLVIGDRLYTDILSGINAGVETALVLTGEATRKDAEESSYKPDYIFPTVRELHEAWK